MKQALEEADRIYVGRIDSLGMGLGSLGSSYCNLDISITQVLKGHRLQRASLTLTVQSIPADEVAPIEGLTYIFFLKACPQRTFAFVKMLPSSELVGVRRLLPAAPEEAPVAGKHADGIAIQVWNTFDLDWENTASVAAGALDSAAHQTQVRIVVNPPAAIPVPVSLGGGNGHAAAQNAKLVFGNITMGPGETKVVTTGADGVLIGTLTSSNLRNSATISSGNAKATVLFGWDNYDGFDGNFTDPPSITPGAKAVRTVKFAHNYVPIVGHRINFYVEVVEYVDAAGKPQKAMDTIEHPDDPTDPDPAHHVSYWASFDPDQDTTSADGVAHATIHWADHPGATSIGTAAYDMTIWSH